MSVQLLQQRQQQQQQMYGGMQDPFYGDLNMLASQQLPSASMAQQQRSPGLRASPGLGASLASAPSGRSDMGLSMGLDQSMGQYGVQGGNLSCARAPEHSHSHSQ